MNAQDLRFETLFDQAPFSVQLLAPDGRTLRVNKAWEALWQAPEAVKAYVLGEYNMLTDPQLLAKGVTPLLLRAFAGESTPLPLVRYDPAELGQAGRPRWVRAQAHPVKNADGQVTEVMLIHEDVTDQVQAEEALKSSEQRLKRLANTIPQLAWMADATGHVHWYNDRWYAYTGTTPEQVQGWGWQQVHDPAVLPQAMARWQHSLRTGDAFEMTFPLRGHDGVYRPFLTLVAPLKNDAGEVVQWFGTNTDISALQQAQLSLAEQRARERAYLEHLPVGVWFIDGQARIEYSNAEGQRIWGPADTPAGARAPIEAGGGPAWRAIRDGVTTHNQQVEIAAADGGRRTLLVSAVPVRDSGGGVTGAVVLHQDVSEAKRLAARTEQLATIIEGTPDFVAIADLQGRLVYMNTAGRRMVGADEHTPLEVLSHQRLCPTWAYERTQQEWLPQALRDGAAAGEGALLTLQGRELPVSFVMLVHRHADGEPEFVSTVARDISERRRAEQALQEADRRKDEFLATLAHELRNPLAPLRNALEVLRLRGEDHDTRDRMLGMMERQVAHTVRLVDDLLEVSRITRGNIQLHPEQVALDELVHQAVETVAPLVEQGRHELLLDLPSEPLALWADRVRLTQVLANLLNNACKYTDAGGRLHLRARRDGDWVELVLSDNGIGIPPDMLERVFELFTQVDRTLGRSQGGLGIGLALVKRLVEMHGGQVRADSDGLGRGSRFTLRLPLAPSARGGRHLAGEAQADAASGRRVLVVDDNADAADSLALLLRLQGHEVRTTYDGEQAYDELARWRPDLALLDIGMPGLSGHALARRVRQQAWGAGLRLVALTGWGQAQDRERARESGFDDHLVKPADPRALEALLQAPAARA